MRSCVFHSNTSLLPLTCHLRVVPMPCRNEPHVHVHKEESNPLKWHGAELSVTILGNWQYYRAKVLRYMRQIAVITPYAQFRFHYKAEDDKNSLDVTFVRRTDKMPPPPKAGWLPPSKLRVHLQLCSALGWWCVCSTLSTCYTRCAYTTACIHP